MQEPNENTDRRFVLEVIALAGEQVRQGRGGPFAAIVVRQGEVVARGANQVTSWNDPTAHAEVVAIREACRRLGDFQLAGCTVYASCEPCPMCLGAIYWARPDRVVFAATRDDAAAAGFDDALIYREIALPPADRAIRFDHVALPESAAPFDAWRASKGRIAY
ncbi:MAG: nucleoside deaminase [Rhodothermales bacterium]